MGSNLAAAKRRLSPCWHSSLCLFIYHSTYQKNYNFSTG